MTNFSDLITFSRSSSAWRHNEFGNLEQVAPNVPRFDYDPLNLALRGLLIEEQRTNLANFSNYLIDPGFTNVNVFASPYVEKGPDGNLSATKMTTILANTDSYISKTINTGVIANRTFTFSLWAWIDAGGHALAELFMYGATGAEQASSLQITLSTTPTRFVFTKTFTGAVSTSVVFRLDFPRFNDQPAGTSCYTAFWQVEEGSFPTSYIPSVETFTSRASTATYIDSNGIMQTAAANIARSDAYNWDSAGVLRKIGLLLENPATNSLIYSSKIGNWLANGAVVTSPSTSIAPDGTLSATDVSSPGNADIFTYRAATVTTTQSPYTTSVYIKKTTGTPTFFPALYSVYLAAGTPTQSAAAILNTTTGTVVGYVGGTAPDLMVQCSNSGAYWRVSLTFTNTTSADSIQVRLYPAWNKTGSGARDNTTAGTNTFWGAQLEVIRYPTSYIPSTDTFTSRASTATYFNSSGVLTSAATNVARSNAYGFDSSGTLRPVGLLLESAATNLLRDSGNCNQSSWTTASATRTLTGETWNGMTGVSIASTGDIWHAVRTSTANYLSLGIGTYSITAFYKAGSSGRLYINLRDNTANSFSGVEGPIGSLVSSAPGTNFGTSRLIDDILVDSVNGVRMVRFTVNVTTAIAQGQIAVGPASVTTGQTVILFGAQVEAGSFPTSYIPTTTASVTRAADISSSVASTRAADSASSAASTRAADVATVASVYPWYNQSEGTLLVEFSQSTNASSDTGIARRSVGLNGGHNSYIEMNRGSTGLAGGGITTSGVLQTGFSPVAVAINAVGKSALAYRENDAALSVNGSTPVTDTSVTLPIVSTLGIGQRGQGVAQFDGHIRYIRYYPRRLSNTELQALTA